MYAFLWVLYVAGFEKAQHMNLQELWVDDGRAPDCFRVTMSIKRFATLHRVLRHLTGTKNVYNLALIRKIFEEFINTKCSNYQVGEYVTIDEMLEAFHDCCKFCQYIADKPAKNGIMFYALVDANIFYATSRVVKCLVTPVMNTGRNITMDNNFTSVGLAEQLLRDHRLTIIGTLHKNKSEIPSLFLGTKRGPIHSSMFSLGEKCLLVS
ncbi:hypothetical protein PR048_011214 [Dryococelus australis]|uniref:PiggyBac transposable element-derived protein domain-containing protein n=1 Tax=Dryococelus australis TaxID=614101 RepID=A0ABQ9HKZ4_9NEOP|nr:hypothetical protein PR048_011214 [Dryococelus australis]